MVSYILDAISYFMHITMDKIISFNWDNFISTLIGAGFGAWGAYYLSIKREKNKNEYNEKAQLIKLVYDINIYIKSLCYYYGNISSMIDSIQHKNVPFLTPIQISSININVFKYGFITHNNPKIYELLTYAFDDIKTIINDEKHLDYMNRCGCSDYDLIEQLEELKRMTIKCLAKMYVGLINVNSFLMKHYNNENLIKNHVLKAKRKAIVTISKFKKQKQNIINNPKLICPYTNKRYNSKQKALIKGEIKYIDEIIYTWIF